MLNGSILINEPNQFVGIVYKNKGDHKKIIPADFSVLLITTGDLFFLSKLI